MAGAGLDSDTRGWTLSIVAGLACCFGATIICVDFLVRLIPSQKSFRIQDSNAFLASSLSLSFGVMLFSALYRMLPSSAKYLSKAGWDHQQGALLVMVCFVVGFIGIQIISRVLHQFLPSHIVDCDHTHQHHAKDTHSHSHRGHSHSRPGRSRQQSMRTPSSGSTIRYPEVVEVNGNASESTPLLSGDSHLTRTDSPSQLALRGDTFPQAPNGHHQHAPPMDVDPPSWTFNTSSRPLLSTNPTAPIATSPNCAMDTRSAAVRNAASSRTVPPSRSAPPLASHTHTTPVVNGHHHGNEARTLTQMSTSHSHGHSGYATDSEVHSDPTLVDVEEEEGECEQMDQGEAEAQHHHHVPENAFLSIGLQTVVAIALHKFPEGFIMYATNHASPALGFNVFMALFVHNIAEGFSMALPLYLAIGSRAKAIAWSSLLGGLTQPMGAGMAVLWFKLANRTALDIDNTSYGCLFAVTAGIMTSVALQLFVESLSLNHNKNLSIFFAFLGMALLGFSSALVAE